MQAILSSIFVCGYWSEGCILSRPDRQETQEVPQVRFRGQSLSIPFGLSLAPRMFTKCMDAVLALLQLSGHPNIELSGWLADISSITGSGDSASGLGARSLEEPRTVGEPSKECPATMSANDLFRCGLVHAGLCRRLWFSWTCSKCGHQEPKHFFSLPSIQQSYDDAQGFSHSVPMDETPFPSKGSPARGILSSQDNSDRCISHRLDGSLLRKPSLWSLDRSASWQ